VQAQSAIFAPAGWTLIVVGAHTIEDCKAATPAEVWRPIVILFVGLALLRYFLVAVRVILPVFEFLFEFHDARFF